MANDSPHADLQRVAWEALRGARGETVTYHTGAIVVEDLVAVKTRPHQIQVATGEAMAVESRAWDWLVDPAELVTAAGVEIVPAAGHWITDQAGVAFRLQAGESDDTAWRWSDAMKTWRRVHTEEQ